MMPLSDSSIIPVTLCPTKHGCCSPRVVAIMNTHTHLLRCIVEAFSGLTEKGAGSSNWGIARIRKTSDGTRNLCRWLATYAPPPTAAFLIQIRTSPASTAGSLCVNRATLASSPEPLLRRQPPQEHVPVREGHKGGDPLCRGENTAERGEGEVCHDGDQERPGRPPRGWRCPPVQAGRNRGAPRGLSRLDGTGERHVVIVPPARRR
eukprot:2028492-Rhodomonas_salina.1